MSTQTQTQTQTPATDYNFEEVIGNERLQFNHKYFGDCIFDIKIFNMANQIMIGYNGGMWSYLKYKDVAFYRLDGAKQFVVRNPFSGDQMLMNSELAGMIVTLYALILHFEKYPTEKIVEQIDSLKDLIWDYARTIGQVDQAFKMID